MNVYAPRQKSSDGRWRFTVQNGAGTTELGYCCPFHVWTAEEIRYYDPASAEEEANRLNSKYGPFESKFHPEGHSTAAEAVQCYREYLLDHQLKFSDRPADDNAQHRCAVDGCGVWTQHAGWIAGESHHFWYLCLAHQSRASVEPLFKGIEKAWGS